MLRIIETVAEMIFNGVIPACLWPGSRFSVGDKTWAPDKNIPGRRNLLISQLPLRRAVGLFLILTSIAALPAVAELAFDDIAPNVLLGQIYPSGSVYLKSFNNGSPRRVLVRGLVSGNSLGSQFQYANFVKAVGDSVFIPGVEHMDDAHSSCGAMGSFEKNRSFNYLAPDFFYASFDYCDPNTGVNLYESSYHNNQSFPVLALAAVLTPEDIKIMDGDVKRPMTFVESVEVARLKKESQSEHDCDGTPRFIDEAKQLALIRLSGSPFQLLISNYDNSTCSGQVEVIYVLDVLDERNLIKSYELHQIRRAD